MVSLSMLKNNNKEGREAIMENLLTTSKEGLKKQQAILEAKGLIENKTLFYIEEVLATRIRRIEKVSINPYNLTREAIKEEEQEAILQEFVIEEAREYQEAIKDEDILHYGSEV